MLFIKMLSKIQPTISKNWKVEAWLIQGSPKKERKRIPQVSKKKQLRLKEGWGEAALFLLIWNESPHICIVCWSSIPEPKTFCFSHKLSKGRYPEYRLNPKNIALVCSMECHSAHDLSNVWNDIELISSLQIHF